MNNFYDHKLLIVPHDYEGSLYTMDFIVNVELFIDEDSDEEYFCNTHVTIRDLEDNLLYKDCDPSSFDNDDHNVNNYDFSVIMNDYRIISGKHIYSYNFREYGLFYTNVYFSSDYNTGNLSYNVRAIVK